MSYNSFWVRITRLLTELRSYKNDEMIKNFLNELKNLLEITYQYYDPELKYIPENDCNFDRYVEKFIEDIKKDTDELIFEGLDELLKNYKV